MWEKSQLEGTCPAEGQGTWAAQGNIGEETPLAFLPHCIHVGRGCLTPAAGAVAPVPPHVPPADGEKLAGVTDGRGIPAALSTQRTEDSSESREEEPVVSRTVRGCCMGCVRGGPGTGVCPGVRVGVGVGVLHGCVPVCVCVWL